MRQILKLTIPVKGAQWSALYKLGQVHSVHSKNLAKCTPCTLKLGKVHSAHFKNLARCTPCTQVHDFYIIYASLLRKG